MERGDEFSRVTDVEVAAELVAEARHFLVELDRRQNHFREARRKIVKTKPTENVWLLSSGSTFVSCELKHADTVKYLDWKLLQGEEDIERAREDLKQKVADLARLEGPDSALAHLYGGFDLKGTNH